jgi:peptidoglycan/LPS O-acetylase OafA/YrhL
VRRLGYTPALDGVRGIAIAIVVGSHAFGVPTSGLGVDLFFVLSGFLITTLLLEGRYSGLKAFYSARARRLLPALVVLLIAYLATTSVTGHHPLRALEASGIALSYSGNLVRAFGNPSLLGALGHTWSLAEEEQFYLVWPLLLLVVLRGRRGAAARVAFWAAVLMTLWGMLLAAGGAPGLALDDNPTVRSIGLAIGCFAALHRDDLAEAARRLLPIAVCVIVAVASLRYFATAHFYTTGALTLFCLSCACLVLVAVDHPGSVVTRTLSLRPLVWLGTISYSLYLWHFPVLIALGVWGPAGRQGSLLLRAFAVSLAVVAACVSTRYVERPFRQRKVPASGCAQAESGRARPRQDVTGSLRQAPASTSLVLRPKP